MSLAFYKHYDPSFRICVTHLIGIDRNLTYLTYLMIIGKEIKIVKERISCDIRPSALFLQGESSIESLGTLLYFDIVLHKISYTG